MEKTKHSAREIIDFLDETQGEIDRIGKNKGSFLGLVKDVVQYKDVEFTFGLTHYEIRYKGKLVFATKQTEQRDEIIKFIPGKWIQRLEEISKEVNRRRTQPFLSQIKEYAEETLH